MIIIAVYFGNVHFYMLFLYEDFCVNSAKLPLRVSRTVHCSGVVVIVVVKEVVMVMIVVVMMVVMVVVVLLLLVLVNLLTQNLDGGIHGGRLGLGGERLRRQGMVMVIRSSNLR